MRVQAKRWIWCLVQGLAAFLVSKTAFAGLCPLCRQALEQGGNEGLVKGFYWSILLIAGIPLLIFSVVSVIVFFRMRKRWRVAVKLYD